MQEVDSIKMRLKLVDDHRTMAAVVFERLGTGYLSPSSRQADHS